MEEDMVKRAAHALLHYINTYTAPHRSLCQQLSLAQILWAGKMLPSEGMGVDCPSVCPPALSLVRRRRKEGNEEVE